MAIPIGAKLFGERLRLGALSLAIVALGGVIVVVLNAPASGDDSTLGIALCVIGIFLWVGYLVFTRLRRGEMLVGQYMAAITPIALLTVLPIGLIDGNLGEVTLRGAMYIAVLSVVSGVAAHGLMVFAQKSVPMGTVTVAQVSQPVLATTWSYLLLDEAVNGRQVAGMAVALIAVLGFIIVNQR